MKPAYGEAERFLSTQVEKFVASRGWRWKKISSFIMETTQEQPWRKDIGFFHNEVHGDREQLKEAIRQRVGLALREAVQEVEERGGDPTYGFRVTPTLALSGVPGHDPSMPDYAICLLWIGPKPMFWPHKVTLEQVNAAKATDDDGYDRDYKAVTGQTPEEFLRDARKRAEAKKVGRN